MLMDQNEIQCAHWGHGQATLFKAYACINEHVKINESIISDELKHTKVNVYAFMSNILTF